MNNIFTNPLFLKLKSLNLPSEDYAIMGRTCMAVHGLIEMGEDIDLIVRGKAWDKACTIAKPQIPASGIGKVIELFDNQIEIFDTWYPGKWDVDQLIDTAEIINGIKFVTLENVKKWKQIYGREKDIAHIKIIDNYINYGKNPIIKTKTE